MKWSGLCGRELGESSKSETQTDCITQQPLPEVTTESRDSSRYLYSDVHGSVIYNSKKVELTRVSTNRGNEKQNVPNAYNGILSNN